MSNLSRVFILEKDSQHEVSIGENLINKDILVIAPGYLIFFHKYEVGSGYSDLSKMSQKRLDSFLIAQYELFGITDVTVYNGVTWSSSEFKPLKQVGTWKLKIN